MVSLIEGFARSALFHPEDDALVLGGFATTYGELSGLAMSIADALRAMEPEPHAMAAVFGQGSLSAYAGILGVLFSGKGYVPLNPGFPIERTSAMFALSEANVLIVGREGLPGLDVLLRQSLHALTVIAPEVDDL